MQALMIDHHMIGLEWIAHPVAYLILQGATSAIAREWWNNDNCMLVIYSATIGNCWTSTTKSNVTTSQMFNPIWYHNHDILGE